MKVLPANPFLPVLPLTAITRFQKQPVLQTSLEEFRSKPPLNEENRPQLALTARCFPMPKGFNVWLALRPSVINPARFIEFICAANATSRCAMPCIYGRT
jgi:hypothetical protein